MKKDINKLLIIFVLLIIFCFISIIDACGQKVVALSDTFTGYREIASNAEIPNKEDFVMEANSVLYIKGNLSILGSLTINDNAKLIVGGDLIQGKNGNVNCNIDNTDGAYIVVFGKYSFQSNKIDKFAADWVLINNTANVYIAEVDKTNWPKDSEPNYKDIKDFIEEYISIPKFLPIELTYFRAIQFNDGIKLEWETASETNNEYFTIEYSYDGVNFGVVGTLEGAGTTSFTNDYKYEYTPEKNGILYFRLKQTDYNGECSHSDVIAINYNKENKGLYFQNGKILYNGEKMRF